MAASKSNASGFLSSFMSFVGVGNNSKNTGTGTPKEKAAVPSLPKYIPVQQPKQSEKPSSENGSSNSSTSSAAKNLATRGNSGNGFPSKSSVSPTAATLNNISANDIDVNVSSPRCDSPPVLPQSKANESSSSQKQSLISDVHTPANRNKRKASPKKPRWEDEEDEIEDEESISQESSSVEDDPVPKKKSLPTPRERTTRKAKEKLDLRRKIAQNSGKKRASIYSEYSDDEDLSDKDSSVADEEEASVSSQAEVEIDYDSDKDPVWKPSLEDRPNTRRSSAAAQDESFGHGQRRRGRQETKKTPSKPSQSTTSRSSGTAAPSQRLTSPQETRKTVTPPPAPPKGPILLTKPEFMPHIVMAAADGDSPGEPHTYQKGDFVIEKKDLDNVSSFPIWRIDSGRLLQKFEPLSKDNRLLHKALSTYSSWTDNIKKDFKGVAVRIVVNTKGNEVVEVLDEYKPGYNKKSSNQNSSLQALADSFNVYIQILVSQSLEPTFLEALLAEPDPYYMDPLEKIDSAVELRKTAIKETLGWTKDFQASIDQLSQYNIVEKGLAIGHCQATGGRTKISEKIVRFYGYTYKFNTLQLQEEIEEHDGQEYLIGRETVQCLPIYHGLQHIKLALYNLCYNKVTVVKNEVGNDDHRVLDACLQNWPWMQQLFQMVTDLVAKADRFCQERKK